MVGDISQLVCQFLSILLLAFAAAWFDLRTGKVPNRLNYAAMLVGVLLSLTGLGPGLKPALTGFAAGGGLFLLFWLSGGMGAGDVKLMAALGTLAGWPRIWDIIFFTALCGAVMAALFLIWRRIPAVITEVDAIAGVPRRKQKMPYAAAIASGTVMALIAGGMR